MAEIEMGPNISNKQFGQGTLFNMKPTPEHRYPRGYTPERMNQVREALGSTREGPGIDPRVAPGKHLEIPHDRGVEHPYLQGAPPSLDVGGVHPDDPSRVVTEHERSIRSIVRQRFAGKHVAETLARSSMPVEQMGAGTAEDWRYPRQQELNRPLITIEEQRAGVGGHYRTDRGPRSDSWNARVSLGPVNTGDPTRSTKWADFTLMHEMGHHRSSVEGKPTSHFMGNLRTGEPHDTPARHGVEEANADRNVLEHYKPDPRSGIEFDPGSMRDYDFSIYNSIGGNRRKQETAQRAYDRELPEKGAAQAVRGRAIVEGMRRDTNQAMYGRDTAPQSFARHLFVRNTSVPSGQKLPTELERDYGQFPLAIEDEHGNRDTPLGTIRSGTGVPPTEQRGYGITPKQQRQQRK